ncbi:hypothetical protein WJX77_006998 [Trebouxia sp. C0004]
MATSHAQLVGLLGQEELCCDIHSLLVCCCKSLSQAYRMPIASRMGGFQANLVNSSLQDFDGLIINLHGSLHGRHECRTVYILQFVGRNMSKDSTQQ